jgi:hypothetical protein
MIFHSFPFLHISFMNPTRWNISLYFITVYPILFQYVYIYIPIMATWRPALVYLKTSSQMFHVWNICHHVHTNHGNVYRYRVRFKPPLKPIYHGWDLSENLVPSLYTGWLIGIPVCGTTAPFDIRLIVKGLQLRHECSM